MNASIFVSIVAKQNTHYVLMCLFYQAVNKANLVSTASSWAYIYDKSPPESGQVFDGILSSSTDKKQDIDFQIYTTRIDAYWGKFYDPHTTVKVYKVAIGTCPGCDDVLKTHDVGIIHGIIIIRRQ